MRLSSNFALPLAALLFMLAAFGAIAAQPQTASLHKPAVTFLYTLPITLDNQQSVPTTAPFQQQIIVNSSQYSQYEAQNLQNIKFEDQSGKVLSSWIESGNSSASTSTIYWVKLPKGIPASSSVTINMEFAAKSKNLLNGTTTGEAAEISPQYGTYDNGSHVFLTYANFAGTTLPKGWYSGVSEGGTGSVTINNGVTISTSGYTRSGPSDYAWLGSNWAVHEDVAEMYVRSQSNNNGQEMILGCSSSSKTYIWTPDEVSYQNGSGLEIENNDSGTASVLATANPNPTLPAVIGFQDGTLFANYAQVAAVTPPICGGKYLATSTNTGYSAQFSFDWIRLRAEPPNGVMPAVTFGQ